MRRISVPRAVVALGLTLAAVSGCGDGAAETVDLSAQPRQRAFETHSDYDLHTVSIPQAEPTGGAPAAPAPPKGSPEWLVAEMARVRAQPASEATDLARLQQDLERRNRRIVALAEETVAKTHDRPEYETQFLAAVGQLLEARVQLALKNDRDNIAALYGDAAALHERDPHATAAVLAGEKLVEFAWEMARRYGEDEPRWLSEFARQARLFAANHPEQAARAAEMLDAAAWSCEAHGQFEEALGCYEILQATFPDSPEALQAVAVVRRLHLPGRPVRLAGPTFDGGYVDLERDHSGKVVLVVFWDTAAPECREILPLIAELHRRFASQGFEVIGVSLDDDERAVEAALEAGAFPGPTIFHAHRKLRRWNSPIAKYYGVREIPMLWLVGRDGRVVSAHVTPEQLPAAVDKLCSSR